MHVILTNQQVVLGLNKTGNDYAYSLYPLNYSRTIGVTHSI